MKYVLSIAVMLLSITPAHAWNALGHRVIADIAWQRLSPETQTSIAAILRRHPRFDEDFAKQMPTDVDEDRWIFQQAAVWPDLIRGNREFDHPTWHDVNFPLFVGGERPLLDVNLSSEFPPTVPQSEWNVAQGVKFCIETMDSDASPSDKALAYCWLLHLIGDLHQPMHTTALFCDRFPTGDRGGNSIPLVQGDNLHSLWDNLLGRSDKPNDVKRCVAELEANRTLWRVGPSDRVEDWIAEGHELAKSFAYSPQITSVVQVGGELPRIGLPESYLQEAGKRARQRVVAAGLRVEETLKSLDTSSVNDGSSLRWKGSAKFLPQPTNQYGKTLPGGGTETVGGMEELATIRFSVTNAGEKPLQITRGEWIVDSVEMLEAGFTTAVGCRLIAHEEHLEVKVENPKKGLRVPVEINLSLRPGEKATFAIWLRTDPTAAVVKMEGRLRLTGDGEALESEKLKCELHPQEGYF